MMYSIEKCFNTKFWTGTAYRSPGYHGKDDDRSQAMAVLSGLATKRQVSRHTEGLEKRISCQSLYGKVCIGSTFSDECPGGCLCRGCVTGMPVC